MIAVDASAVVAILFGEPEAGAFDSVLSGPVSCSISAVSVLEAETVVRGRTTEDLVPLVRRLLSLRNVRIVPLDDVQAQLASDAYGRFGKGFHAARLNLGDCAAYALAKSMDAPLLYKGDDFAQTDLVAAVTGG